MTLIGHLIGSLCEDAEMDREWMFYPPRAVSRPARSSLLAGVHAAVVSVILICCGEKLATFASSTLFIGFLMSKMHFLRALEELISVARS